MKKGFLFIAVGLLLLAQASAFIADVSPDTVSVPLDGFAKFNLTIKNDADYDDTFRIFFLQYPDWDLRTDPIENPIKVDIVPGEEKTKGIVVEPLHVVGAGTYIINIKVESEKSGVIVTMPAKVYLSTAPVTGEYKPTVTVNTNVPEEVNPSEGFDIDLDIKNQNILVLGNLTLIAESANGLFEKEIAFSLKPKERVLQTIHITLEPATKPQEDVLSIEIKKGNETITGGIFKKIRVIAYNEIEQKKRQSSFLLRYETTIAYTNKGNVPYDGPVKVEYPILRRPFMSAPSADFVYENGKGFIEWSINLEPGSSTEVEVVESYRIILYLLIILVACIAAYYYYRSPLIIEKGAANIQMKEGGISEVKVIITLKNRGNAAVKEINVSDKVPRIGHIKKDVDIGVLHPTKILAHEQKGALIKWDIDHIEPGEERVISYGIGAGLPITGGIQLPRATASFNAGGRKFRANSNALRID